MIGELAFGGDWACADGDFGTLACLARRIASHVSEPLHCELVALAELCKCDPDRAAYEWPRLREQLYRSEPPAG